MSDSSHAAGTRIPRVDLYMQGFTRVTGYTLALLRNHFQSHAQENPLLRDFVWSADSPTGILIESHTKWDPKNTLQAPAVLVRRNAFRPEAPTTIGDRLQGGVTREGDTRHMRILSGSLTVLCISQNGMIADLLAGEIFNLLLEFRLRIGMFGGMLRCDVGDVSPVSVLQEAEQMQVVTVDLMMIYQHTWVVKEHAPRAKISLSTIIGLQ